MSVKTISPDVLSVLKQAECDGLNVRLTMQLDRPLYTRTAKVLQALGGKWNRSAKATVFPEEASPLIADAVATGAYVDAKKQFQFYETPPAVIDELLSVAGIRFDGKLVLEPSCGHGAIAREIFARGGEVDGIELNPKTAERAKALGCFRSVLVADFLEIKSFVGEQYDAVIMNPPFTRSADMRHVRFAWQFVRPGGCLAAVMSPGFTFRQDKEATSFREFSEHVGAQWRWLPEDSFRSSGTSVSALIVWASK